MARLVIHAFVVLIALAACLNANPDPNAFKVRIQEEARKPEWSANQHSRGAPCSVLITAPESSADSNDPHIRAFVKCSNVILYDKVTPRSKLKEVDLSGMLKPPTGGFKLFAGGAYLYIENNRAFYLYDCEIKNLRPFPGVETTAPVVINGGVGTITDSTIEGNKGFKVSGAIYATSNTWGTDVDVDDTVVKNNSAEECGGFTVTQYAKMDATRVKFIKNFGQKFAGAVRVTDLARSDYEDCIFEGVPPSDEFLRYVNGISDVLPNESIPRAGAVSIEDQSKSDIEACNFTNHHGHLGTVFSNGEATLDISWSNFRSNSVSYGGAVYAKGDYLHSAKIWFSEFHGNSARWGGALMVMGKGLFGVYLSNFSKNNAQYGGVLFGDHEHLSSTGYTTCQSSTEGSRITMKLSSFKDNTARESGGALYSKCSQLLMKSNKFHNNTSGGHGGAIFMHHSLALNTTLCEYVNNTAGSAGGAVFINKTSEEIVFKACQFQGNKAGLGGGGAVHASNAEKVVQVKLTTFSDNEAEGSGGALALVKVADLDLHDSGVDGNRAGKYGGAIFSEGLQKAIVHQANFTKNNAGGNDGGAFSFTKSGGVALKKVLLDSNTAKRAGGAVHLDDVNHLNISDSTFQFNRAKTDGGGAIFGSKMGSLLVVNELRWGPSKKRALMSNSGGSVFTNNSAGGNGGAISLNEAGSAELKGVMIINNEGAKNGGGITVDNAGAVLMEDTSIGSNKAQGAGGGLAVFGADKVELQRLRIFKNSAFSQGGAIKAVGVSQFDITGTDISKNTAGEGAGMDVIASNLTGSVVTFALNEAGSSGGALTCSGDSKIDVTRSLFDFNYAPDAGSILTKCHCNVTASDCAFKRDKERSNNGDFFESAHKCSGVATEHCNFWGRPWRLSVLWLIMLVVITAAIAGLGIGGCRAFVVMRKKRKRAVNAEEEALLPEGTTISYTASSSSYSSYSSYYDDQDHHHQHYHHHHPSDHHAVVMDIHSDDEDDQEDPRPAPQPVQRTQGNSPTTGDPNPPAATSTIPIAHIGVDPCSAPLSSSPSTLCSEPMYNNNGEGSSKNKMGAEGITNSDGDCSDKAVVHKKEGGHTLLADVPVGTPVVDAGCKAGPSRSDNRGGEPSGFKNDANQDARPSIPGYFGWENEVPMRKKSPALDLGAPSGSNENGANQDAPPSIPSYFGWENEVPRRKKSSDLDSDLNTEDLASSFDSSEWSETSSERNR